MKKKKIIVILVVIGVLLALCLTIIGIRVRNKKQKEQENLLRRQSLYAERVLRDVGATGEVVIQDDKVVINNLEFNERELLLRINYYNAYTGSELTLEQVEEQFEIYIINYDFTDGNTEELEDYCAFVEEKGLMATGACDDFEAYDDKVAVILIEMGTDKRSATREQLEEACQKALEEN